MVLSNHMIKIFLGGFPLDSTELELVQLVSLYGEVSTIKIVRDKISKKCKGYAFLEMKDEHGADRVIEALDNSNMKGKPLTVSKVPETPVKTAFQANRVKRPRRII